MLFPIEIKSYWLGSLLRCLLLLWAGSGLVLGETRLLTGDGEGKLHVGGGTVMDLSYDGDLVLFYAVVPGGSTVPGIPKNGLYLRKITTDELEFVGDDGVANSGVRAAAMSDDGRYLTWSSTAHQIYWRDRESDATYLVTKGVVGNYGAPRMSGDGRYVAFTNTARSLVADGSKLPNMGRVAVYLFDSEAQTTELVSLNAAGGRLSGVGAGGSALESFDFSKDGRFVVFSTEDLGAHPDRVAGMNAGFQAVYRRDLVSGEVVLLNRNVFGAVADGNFILPRVSADGGRVAFMGKNTGLPGWVKMDSELPLNMNYDIYVKEVGSGQVWSVTKTMDGSAHSGAESDGLVLDDAGANVAFSSYSSKLVEDDDPGSVLDLSDVFRASLLPWGEVELSLVTKAEEGTVNISHSTLPLITGSGNYVSYGATQFADLGIEGVSALAHGVGSGTFPATEVEGLAYFIWALNLPIGEQGAGDNPAGDGVPNLVKYFVGSDAQVPDLRFLPVSGMAKGSELGLAGDARDYQTLSVRIRRVRPQGYDWSVQTAPNLLDLVNDPVEAIQVGPAVPVDGMFDQYLFRFPTPVEGKGFMRLKVSMP